MFEDLRRQYVDLAQPRLGAEVVYATDEFFGDKARLIDPAEPVFIPGKHDENGKWMDGWETRRKRTPGHDWCVVRLGVPGVVAGVEIDTRHFTGNYPPGAEIELCRSDEKVPSEQAGWTKVTETVALKGDDRIYVPIEHAEPVTHVRLNILPDGGVARLRVWGRVAKDWSAIPADARVDLLAMENGGRGIAASDEHYGRIENLTAPGPAANMGDGWETRRQRDPDASGDWAVFELGCLGMIDEIVVDTSHFKGNYPAYCMLEGAFDDESDSEMIGLQSLRRPDEVPRSWAPLTSFKSLEADKVHVFHLIGGPPLLRYVRFSIHPDGGVARLRLIGRAVPDGKLVITPTERQTFIDRYRELYDHSPWVVERAAELLPPPEHSIISLLRKVVEEATPEEQLALIRAHPELGSKAAVDGDLSEASAAEQAKAGLDRLTPEEFDRFHTLNAAYREKFGFPFIMNVWRWSKDEILEAMERRLKHERDVEIKQALYEINSIAQRRLEAM